MPLKSNSDALPVPEQFVSLNYRQVCEGADFLEARRKDGTVLRLQAVNPDDKKYLLEAYREIDRQIDELRKILKR